MWHTGLYMEGGEGGKVDEAHIKPAHRGHIMCIYMGRGAWDNSFVEIKFTYHKIHPCKVYKSFIFSIPKSQIITTVNFGTFSSPPEEVLYSLAVIPIPPCLGSGPKSNVWRGVVLPTHPTSNSGDIRWVSYSSTHF